jgi:valyl-tRNA synthetase
VFDTWFSSGLWPIATLGWPDRDAEDLRYFYPTDLLSTAREIMYLWVARMITMGLHFEAKIPFEKVNVHSIVLAEDGTKMSRSKGNTIDPLELLDEYGTDAVRFGLLYQSSTQDFPYSRERAEMGRAFVTKLWNALRFVLAYPETEENGELSPSDRWILSEFSRTIREYDAYLEECEFSEAMRRIYAFAWNQFADWYIEIAKAAPSSATPRVLREVFHGILKLLHPVMPFATEEMASVMGEQALLATQRYPEPDPALEDEEADRLLDRTRRAVSAVRSFRAESKVDGELEGLVPQGIDEDVFAALAGVRPAEAGNGASRASLPAGDVVVEILLSDEMRRGEIERLKREISRAEQEVARAQSKLSNEKFVTNAPERIVAGEREKLDVNARMLETLSRRLDEYT